MKQVVGMANFWIKGRRNFTGCKPEVPKMVFLKSNNFVLEGCQDNYWDSQKILGNLV